MKGTQGGSTAGANLTLRHRCHDYHGLVRRWRAVAAAAGLVLRPWAKISGYYLYYLRSKGRARGGVYLSAGIHGDEPAGSEGLITWAERNVWPLRSLPCLIFPCLNPWGLINNSRRDEAGRDLNRVFRDESMEFVMKWRALLPEQPFEVGLCLHEDYDGQGSYVYEPIVTEPYWGEDLVGLSEPLIPVEPREDIDGRRARDGVVRVEIDPSLFPELPEAGHLYRKHSKRLFTFETPSEFALADRVEVHVRVIEECVRRSRLKPDPPRN